ncbi:UNVERIFIED_CONTAM: hypothetical protein NCL1_23501 [Trichonephila clavipes]
MHIPLSTESSILTSSVSKGSYKQTKQDAEKSLLFVNNKFDGKAVKRELWLSLVGTRLLTLHGPQEIGLTSAGGKSRSCYCSDPKERTFSLSSSKK